MSLRSKRPTTVRIDGDQVRKIREAKGLTQLYVAEVVKVSTDTVSRWENNRTQAIRPDNASALADALEVDLNQILLPEGDQAIEMRSSSSNIRRKMTFAIILCSLLLITLTTWYFFHQPAPELEAHRRLPAYTPPGTRVPVIVTIHVISGTVKRLVLREQIPSGWELLGATPPPDRGPDNSGQLRWILPVGQNEAQVAYVVRAPSDGRESTAYRFSGEVVTAGKTGTGKVVQGENRIDLEFIHWADEDGDFQIGDAEVLDALERIEATQQLGMDTRILRDLWGAGEYRWVPTQHSFQALSSLFREQEKRRNTAPDQ